MTAPKIRLQRSITQAEFVRLTTALGAYGRDAIIDGKPVWEAPLPHQGGTSNAAFGTVGDISLFWDHDDAVVSAPQDHEVWTTLDQIHEELDHGLIRWSQQIQDTEIRRLVGYAEQDNNLGELGISQGTSYPHLQEHIYALVLRSTITPGDETIEAGAAMKLIRDGAQRRIDEVNLAIRMEREHEERIRAMGIGTG